MEGRDDGTGRAPAGGTAVRAVRQARAGRIAVSVAVLSYLGFDAIASFAEEVTGGSRKVARAVLFCLALAGVLFVAQTYLAALLEPVSSARPAAERRCRGRPSTTPWTPRSAPGCTTWWR